MHAKRKTQSAKLRLVAVIAAAGIVAGLGCSDATAIRAQLNNIESKPTVYAMNGTPVTLNSAIHIRSAAATRLDAGFLYDLAFDFDSTGAVKVYTVAKLGTELVATHRVGMQIRTESFSTLKRAPTSGYVYDTVMTLPVGKVMALDVVEQACVNTILGVNIRSKMIIDSVNVAAKAIYLHLLSDPNCGFRGLEVGEPKD